MDITLLGLTFAGLGMLSQTLMVISDRLLIEDLYGGDTLAMWFISCLATSILGMTAAVAYILIVDINFSAPLLIQSGPLIFVSGVLGAITLYAYLKSLEFGESSIVSSWFAASPIYVYLGLLILNQSGLWASMSVTFSSLALIAALFSSLGLWLIEYYPEDKKRFSKPHKFYLLLMILCNTGSVLLIDQTLAASQDSNLNNAIALLPIFFTGFIIGLLPVVRKKTRDHLITLWPRIKVGLLFIFALEVIGMAIFLFEFLGLSELDPTFVAIIIGSHLVLVVLCEHLLGWWGRYMKSKNILSKNIFGINIQADGLNKLSINYRQMQRQMLGVSLVILGIIIFVLI